MSSIATPAMQLDAASRPLGVTMRRVAPPIIAVIGLVALLLSAQLARVHGDIAGLVNFGSLHIADTQPPAGAPIVSPDGYDGQLYWIQAHDPLLIHRITVERLMHAYPGYFLQRPAFPAFAFLLAAGQPGLLPLAMLAINIGCILALTATVACWALSHDRSPWWGAAVGAMPGVMMPMLRDLSDVLAITTMLIGLIAWRDGRRWAAAALLSVAVLSREPMTIAVAAIGVETVAAAWRSRSHWPTLAATVRRAWPPLVVPTLAFVGWQMYTRFDVHQLGAGTARASTAPVTSLVGYAGELHGILSVPLTGYTLWDGLYLALMVAVSLLAVARLRHGLSAVTVGAILCAALLLVILFGDVWGETRYSAPLFGLLALSAIERRSAAVTVAMIVSVGLTVLVPAALI